MEKLVLVLTALAPVLASVNQSSAQGDGRTGYFVTEINKAKAHVDKYISPEKQIYLVDLAGEDWLFRAVSKTQRDEWLKTTQFSPEQSKEVNDALDALAASAAKKLPVYLPYDKFFSYGTAEEKELIKVKAELAGVSYITIHKIGFEHEVWQIIKDDNGTPKYRYKKGYIWFRNKQADHPYCRVDQMNVSQNYEGGGTYGQSFAGYVGRWISGCPK